MVIELIPTGGGPIHVKHDGALMGLIRCIDGEYLYNDDRYGCTSLSKDNLSINEAREKIAAFIVERAKTINPFLEDDNEEDEE